MLPLASGEDLMLAGGGYTAKTNPTAEANLALDASDIKESDDLDEKMKIYSDGQNTDTSLANLSLKAPETMAGDELYSIYTHAFNYIGTEKEHEQKPELAPRRLASPVVPEPRHRLHLSRGGLAIIIISR